MSGEKPCSKLQAFFLLEGRRMLKEAMTANPGDKLEAQVASGAIALEEEFDFCWRVHSGRCGMRAFLRLYAKYRTMKAKQKREATAAEVVQRLYGVERSLAELADRLPPVARKEPGCACGDGPLLGVVRAPA